MESWPDIVQPPKDERRRSSILPQCKINCKAFAVFTGGYDGNICLRSVNEMEERIVTRQLVRLLMIRSNA